MREVEKQRKAKPKTTTKRAVRKSATEPEEEKVWGSMVKQALKRRKPDFNETYHGFRSFSQLLEEAQARKLLTLEHDEKSGGYIIKLPRV